jgi:hypothetical protein
MLKSQICNLHTRKVTNRLTQYQLPIMVDGRLYLVAIELLHNASRFGLEFL